MHLATDNLYTPPTRPQTYPSESGPKSLSARPKSVPRRSRGGFALRELFRNSMRRRFFTSLVNMQKPRFTAAFCMDKAIVLFFLFLFLRLVGQLLVLLLSFGGLFRLFFGFAFFFGFGRVLGLFSA